MRITDPRGTVVRAKADDGFLSVEHDTVTIVARYAELVSVATRFVSDRDGRASRLR